MATTATTRPPPRDRGIRLASSTSGGRTTVAAVSAVVGATATGATATGATGAGASSRAPQAPQNFAPSTLAAPQAGQYMRARAYRGCRGRAMQGAGRPVDRAC
jgi:hypothetical protein